ncbi:MAG: hypothetical protein R2844_03745 [Caldilineales bacterium]
MSHVPPSAPVFAHAAEEEFAHLLDFYGVRWEYEPRTFVLRVDSAGNPVAAFTPDFYLPDEDLYVEITTMRPKQVRRKNRKIRWLLEQFPEINIKLYKRSDFRQLLAKHGLDDLARVPWIAADSDTGDDDVEELESREMGENRETQPDGSEGGR